MSIFKTSRLYMYCWSEKLPLGYDIKYVSHESMVTQKFIFQNALFWWKLLPYFLCLLEAINYILCINLPSVITCFFFSLTLWICFSPCLRLLAGHLFPTFAASLRSELSSSLLETSQRNQSREGRSLNGQLTFTQRSSVFTCFPYWVPPEVFIWIISLAY